MIRKFHFLAIAIYLGLTTHIYAGELIAPTAVINDQSNIVDLGLKGKQLGQVKSTYLIPLILEQAPIKASIELSFVILTTGICPTSYFPTEIFLNNESIAEIDFRELDEGSKQSLSIELPMPYQQQGKNQIKIITGDCNEGLDSLRFNDVALHIEKSS
ncbi:MAG: hypothetical protein KAT25_10890 [Sulfuriflexus sp.]|nr:hypothetical protein [Sulfuriflexus sp.]